MQNADLRLKIKDLELRTYNYQPTTLVIAWICEELQGTKQSKAISFAVKKIRTNQPTVKSMANCIMQN
jgi:hypothetical protein